MSVTKWAGTFGLHQTVNGVTQSVRKHNQLQYDWGTIACKLLGQGDASYRLSYVYLEFENLASSSTVVTAPSFGRNEGVGYYTSLTSSGTKDFLRLPLLSLPAIQILADSGTDIYSTYFTATDGSAGNKLSFVAQTRGLVGVGGKTFSDTVNSKIYGIAIAAAPVPADYTQDLIYAREYYSATDQMVKLANSQIAATYEIEFP